VADLVLPPKDATGRIRFASEQQLFEELRKEPAVVKAVEEGKRHLEAEANRRRLLASALRITERIVPSLAETVSAVQRITHLHEVTVETYIHNDPRQNACCMYFDGGGLFVLITSGLYTNLTRRQLLYVIGHEFGHAIYRHHAIPVREMLSKEERCEAELALRLMAWSRRAEISADRVGLLCCQDIDAATKALIKLSCGLTEDCLEFDLPAYVSQMEDIKEISETVRDVEDFFSSHPFNPIRVVALSHYWDSQTLTELLGHGPARHTDAEVDQRVSELLRFMDPKTEEETQAELQECLVWGGYWVAASDGRIDQLERRAIAGLADSKIVDEATSAIKASKRPLDLIRQRFHQAAQKCCRLPPPDRHQLIQQLIAVAKANLDVDRREKAALQSIGKALQVGPVFVDKILQLYE